jgi:hypothetical protein
MDITWVTERIALGGGIWNARNMGELARIGITHILNMQLEFDDRPLAEPYGARLYVHCAAGVHRAPMMTLAVLCAMGFEIDAAMVLIETQRPVVDFADVYVESVRRFLDSRVESEPRSSR